MSKKKGWYIAKYSTEHDLEIVRCDGTDDRENIYVNGSELSYAESEFWYIADEPIDLDAIP